MNILNMINKIQYIFHLLLNHKNRIIIHLFILSLIYLSFYSPKMILCMMEDTNLPEIAESKESVRPSHQVVALKNEIVSYAIPYAELQEQLDFYKQEVANLHEKNFHLERENERLRNEIDILETFPVNFY